MVDLGVGLGLRQGEMFGLSPEDIDTVGGVVHVRRQLVIVRGRRYFAPPKRGKSRVVGLPDALGKRLQQHLECFPAKPVTLPWGDPDEPITEKEKRERAPRTHSLVVTNSRGGGCYGGCYKDCGTRACGAAALGGAGIIGRKVPEDDESGWAPSGEYGLHVLRHTYA